MNNYVLSMEDIIYEKVIELYLQGYSVKEIAARYGISSVKTGRILITEGLWKTRRSEEIRELLELGKTKEEIADILSITIKAVEAYMPYQKGVYGSEQPSTDAVRSKQYRTRINRAKSVAIMNESKTERERIIMKDTSFETRILHIELVTHEKKKGEINRVLHEYGGVISADTITRDIVIPTDMPLYALHYCIERAFGFLNEHLHKFTLPDYIIDELIGDKDAQKWIDLCGVLFRDPNMNEEDLYWNEDYMKGSFRKWQKSKYTGPYITETPGESFEECQTSLKEFFDHFPYAGFKKEDEDKYGIQYPYLIREEDLPSIRNGDEFTIIPMKQLKPRQLTYVMENSCFELIERLRPAQLLAVMPDEFAEGDPKENGYTAFTDKIIYKYDFGDDWEFEITMYDDPDILRDCTNSKSIKDSTYQKAVELCMEKHCPVCIHHDGGFLVEDAGGVYGYIQFLRAIHPEEEYHAFMEGLPIYSDNGPYEDRESSLQWAYGLDWTEKPIIDRKLL